MNTLKKAVEIIADYDIPKTSGYYLILLENVTEILKLYGEKEARKYITESLDLYGTNLYF